jgi:hypothetical protein
LKFFFENISKDKFISLLTYLKTLKIRELFGLLNLIRSDNLTNNAILRPIFHTFEIEFKLLVDSLSKKIFLFGFIFTLIANIWLTFFKKIILLPFKLGIFSFVYSMFGIDVTWFLNIFNIFTFNVPYWVYFQYLTLYNSWLTWWHGNVNIKSISTVAIQPIKEVRSKLNKIKENKETIEIEKPSNNKVWYIVGGILVIGSICLAIWYFDPFNLSDTGSGSDSSSSQGRSPGIPINSIADLPTNRTVKVEIPSGNTSDVRVFRFDPAPIEPKVDPVAEVNNEWQFRNPSSNNVDASSSSSATNNPWDNEGPPSPTSSTDSSETIIPSSSTRSRRKGRLSIRGLNNDN